MKPSSKYWYWRSDSGMFSIYNGGETRKPAAALTLPHSSTITLRVNVYVSERLTNTEL